MRKCWLICISLLGGLLLATATAMAAEDLKNDGATDGAMIGFQAGFISGEIGAVRLVPTISCPCQVTEVSFFFGGVPADDTVVGIYVWEDASLTDEPGVQRYQGEATINASDTALQVVEMSQQNVFINGPFRIGIEAPQPGLPNIARDNDGLAFPDRNLVYADLFSGLFAWLRSEVFGAEGDWIIRARIESLVATDGDGDGVLDPDDNCPTVTNADQSDTGTVASPTNPTGAGPDGVGDACQCGDVNGDGKVLNNDSTLIRRFLVGFDDPAFQFARCNVLGDPGNGPGSCNQADSTAIRRALVGLTTPVLLPRNCGP